MIGAKGQTDIILGYECRRWADFPADEQNTLKLFFSSAQDLKAFTDALDAFATKIKDLMLAQKKLVRAEKTALEDKKNLKIGQLNATIANKSALEAARRDFLRKEYVPALRKIGLTSNQVKDVVRDAKKDKTYQTLTGKVNSAGSNARKVDSDFCMLKWNATDSAFSIHVVSGKVVKKQFPLFRALTDVADTYVVVDNSTTRPVYRKKGFQELNDVPTEYVRDDDGVFTRRYGVAGKYKSDLESMFADGSLRGKQAKARPVGPDPLAKDPGVFQVAGFEGGDTLKDRKEGDPLTLRQMLHVHQELGSRDSQRGVCLTSISTTDPAKLKTMYSNNGAAFVNADTIPVFVDLAKVPKDRELLYNLYRPEAQAKATSVPISTKGSTFDDASHMLDSVSKNREIFLRVLVPDFITNLNDIKTKLGIK